MVKGRIPDFQVGQTGKAFNWKDVKKSILLKLLENYLSVP